MVVNGDVFEYVDRTGGILFHQVNCQKRAGAGIALQIRQRWSVWYDDYMQYPAYLGDALLTRVEERIWVASLYGQYKYGRGTKQTHYPAFASALEASQSLIQGLHGVSSTIPVYFPHGIACGLAGGDWEIIEPMILAAYPTATIVKYRKN